MLRFSVKSDLNSQNTHYIYIKDLDIGIFTNSDQHLQIGKIER
jgi:hypothetical protein